VKGSNGSAPAGLESGCAGARNDVALLSGDGVVRVHLLFSTLRSIGEKHTADIIHIC
jgi:hypothetical protein